MPDSVVKLSSLKFCSGFTALKARMNRNVHLTVPWSLGKQVVQDAATIEGGTVPVLFDQIFASVLATSKGQQFHQNLKRWGNFVATLSTLCSGLQGGTSVDLTLQDLIVADLELDQLQSWPCHGELSHSVATLLSQDIELIPDQDVPGCVEAVEAIAHGRSILRFRELRERKCFICSVCLSWVGNSRKIQCSMPSSATSDHRVCRDCLRTWALLPEQLQRMTTQRSFTLPCLCRAGADRCPGTISAEDLASCGRCQCAVRPCSCSRLATLCRDFEFRDRVWQHAGWSRHLWGHVVECPREGCVGLAYADTGVAMCFMCEHEWEAERSLLRVVGRIFSRFWEDLPTGCKRCPTCRVPIEKDGGCDHMTCRCGCQFSWSTLRPYPLGQ